MKIIKKELKWDYEQNKGFIYSLFEDRSVGMIDEPLNSEEAAKWEGEHRY